MTDPLSAMTTWSEPDPDALDGLVRNAAMAADTAFIYAPEGTPHEAVRAVVRATLRVLLANGLITAVPQEDWPEYVRVDAP